MKLKEIGKLLDIGLPLIKYRMKEANKKLKHLSGGMIRRVGIAQAMLNDPKVLILDEPTAGLDPNERIRFRNLISELSGDRLVLLSTHIVSDIEYIANEVWLMGDGEILHKGTVVGITRKMPEKVWKCRVRMKDVEGFVKKYKVSNIKTESNGVELRIIANNVPTQNSIQVETTLEDIFLYYFGESVGKDNDSI